MVATLEVNFISFLSFCIVWFDYNFVAIITQHISRNLARCFIFTPLQWSCESDLVGLSGTIFLQSCIYWTYIHIYIRVHILYICIYIDIYIYNIYIYIYLYIYIYIYKNIRVPFFHISFFTDVLVLLGQSPI